MSEQRHPTDDELTRRLRDELDELVAGVRHQPPLLPGTRGAGVMSEAHRNRRIAAGVAAAAVAALVVGLVVVRTGDDEAPAAPSATLPLGTTPSSTPGSTIEPAATTTIVTEPDPGVTSPPVTEVHNAPIPNGPRYEAVGTVLESPEHGPQLCLGGVAESLPPQCSGIDLVNWSWDRSVSAYDTQDGTTWTSAYVAGVFLADAYTLTLFGSRNATQDDSDRLGSGLSTLDFSVPCAEPEDGWPARKQEWPAEVSQIEGYAGAWVDSTQQVMTVKFVGDLDAAEAQVEQYYSGAVCYAPATHTEAELLAIQAQLMAISSVRVVESSVHVDATGEWVDATLVEPDLQRQAAFDAEFGLGVVRLRSALHPLDDG